MASAPEVEQPADGVEDADPVEESIARAAAMYSDMGELAELADEPIELDQDELLRMAMEHGELLAKVGTFVSQVKALRGALRRVLAATDRYSDSRRASWWLEAHNTLRRGVDA